MAQSSAPALPFCVDWQKADRTPIALQRYVAREIARAQEDGQPLLLSILRTRNDEIITLAGILLTEGTTTAGDVVKAPPAYTLKLRDDPSLVLEPCDPDGRAMPEDERKLVVKVGNRGGNVRPNRDNSSEAQAFDSRMRLQWEMSGESKYITADVTTDPAVYSYHDASVILARYGVGVQRQLKQEKRFNGRVYYVDQWLVEELPAVQRKSPAKAKGA